MNFEKSQYDYGPFLKIVDFFWKRELEDINSIWYKDKKIEEELLKINPRARKLQCGIAKSIKFSILSKGKFYYTQREMAEYFNTFQKNIYESIKVLERYLKICFIKLPTKVINPSRHRNSSGKFIPVPIKMLFFIDEYFKFCNYPYALKPNFNDNNINENNYLLNQELKKGDGNEVDGVQGVVDGVQGVVDGVQLSIVNKNKYLQAPYVYLYLPMYNNYISSYKLDDELNKELRSLLSSFDFQEKSKRKQKLISLKGSRMKTKSKTFGQEKSINSSKLIHLEIKPVEPKPKKFLLKAKEEPIKYKYKHYGYIGFKNPFKNLNHIENKKALGEKLNELILFNFAPCTEETIELIKFWNKVDNPRFSTHKEIFNKSNTFNELRILVSYRIHFSNATINSIENGVLNFSALADKHRRLKYKKKISLSSFLMFDEWFNSCVGKSLNESVATAYAKTPDYEKTFGRVLDSFAKYFHHGSLKLAKSDIDGNYYAFLSFTNQMVDDHKTLYLKDKTISEYVDMYFKFIKEYTENWKMAPSVTLHILGPRLRGQFFRSTRHEPGWEDFGTEISEKEQKG